MNDEIKTKMATSALRVLSQRATNARVQKLASSTLAFLGETADAPAPSTAVQVVTAPSRLRTVIEVGAVAVAIAKLCIG